MSMTVSGNPPKQVPNFTNTSAAEELQARMDELERRIEALEKRCGKIAMFSYGENDKRIKDHERRIEKLERKLNHRGER